MKRLCPVCFAELTEKANYCPVCGKCMREQTETEVLCAGGEKISMSGMRDCSIYIDE